MRRGNKDAAGVVDGIAIARELLPGPIPEGFKIVGRMEAILRDADTGEIKDRRVEENLIVSAGRDAIIERLDSAPATAQPSHMEVGTGTTAVAAGQTALVTALDRNALTSSIASGGVLTMVANWAAGDATNAAITEAGVFNAASAGTMYSRAVFTAINKGANDTLQITWTYTLTPS
jgi:hypothetical protein